MPVVALASVSFAGFYDRRAYILTQHPLDHTMSAYWQMIWEQDVHLIVMLSSVDGQVRTF